MKVIKFLKKLFMLSSEHERNTYHRCVCVRGRREGGGMEKGRVTKEKGRADSALMGFHFRPLGL